VAADLAAVRRLAGADHGLAVVATTRADGSVHATVVNAGVIDHPLSGAPAVAFVARGDARKVALLRAGGRASITFRAGWEWAGVEGPVTLLGPDDHPDGFAPAAVAPLLRDVFTAAGGSHDDWDAYDRVMAVERRLAVVVTPERILPAP
jgi:PPOX class probable F420-dependent enzyme